MRIVLIDDEQLALDELQYFLNPYKVDIVGMYRNPSKVLDNIEKEQPDTVFLDIDMPGISGIELASKIRSILPNIIIVFVTAHSQFAFEAYQVHPAGYVMKPVNEGYFRNTMKYVFQQYELLSLNKREKAHKDIEKDLTCIKCFGLFEIRNHKNERMKFPTLKVKELLSYFICNVDKPIYRDELLSLFSKGGGGKSSLNNYYVTLHRLRTSISHFGFMEEEINLGKNYNFHVADGLCDLVDFQRFIKHNSVIEEKNEWEAKSWIDKFDGVVFRDLDLEWINEVNEWVLVQMESLGIKLAAYYKGTNQELKSEPILFRLLDINPLWAEGYEFLLRMYMDRNDKDKYSLFYKRYYKLMKEELKLKIEPVFRGYI